MKEIKEEQPQEEEITPPSVPSFLTASVEISCEVPIFRSAFPKIFSVIVQNNGNVLFGRKNDNPNVIASCVNILNEFCEFVNKGGECVGTSRFDYLYIQNKNTFEYIKSLYGITILPKYGDFKEGEILALVELKKIYPSLEVCDSLINIFSSIPTLQKESKDNIEKDIFPYRYSVSDNKVYENVYMIDLKSAYPTYIINNLEFSNELRDLFKQMVQIRETHPEMKRIQNSLTGMFKCPEFKYKSYELYYKIIGGVRNIVEQTKKKLEEFGCTVLYSYTDSLHFKADNIPKEKICDILQDINNFFSCVWNLERVSKKVLYLQGFGESCYYFYSQDIPTSVNDIVSKTSLNEKDFGSWSLTEIK